MTALTPRRNVHNLTPWPLSEYDTYDDWGWTRQGTITFPSSNVASFQHTGGETTTAYLTGHINSAVIGRQYLLRATIQNKQGTIISPTIAVNGGQSTNSTPFYDLQNGNLYMTFESTVNGLVSFYIGIGLFPAAEISALDCGYEVTNVAIQQGSSIPMEYHNLLDDGGYVWNDLDPRLYGGDKSKVAYNRSGEITINGRYFTETYGSNTTTTDDNVIAIFGDSNTQSPISMTGLINTDRDDVTLYGDTIGGQALVNIIDNGIEDSIISARDQGVQHGGLKASRVIVQRCVNDMWIGGSPNTGPQVVQRAVDIMLQCLRMGFPVLFFNCTPVAENTAWGGGVIPDAAGLASMLYYNDNIESALESAAIAEGQDPSNIFFHDILYMEEDSRPGSFVLEEDYNGGDGIHYSPAGSSKIYTELVTSGYLDTFIEHDFIVKSVLTDSIDQTNTVSSNTLDNANYPISSINNFTQKHKISKFTINGNNVLIASDNIAQLQTIGVGSIDDSKQWILSDNIDQSQTISHATLSSTAATSLIMDVGVVSSFKFQSLIIN